MKLILGLSSIGESLPLHVTGANEQNADVADLTDVIAPLRPHINILNYPKAKPSAVFSPK